MIIASWHIIRNLEVHMCDYTRLGLQTLRLDQPVNVKRKNSNISLSVLIISYNWDKPCIMRQDKSVIWIKYCKFLEEHSYIETEGLSKRVGE